MLQLRDVEMPAISADSVLIRLHAASLNHADIDYPYGRPCSPRGMAPAIVDITIGSSSFVVFDRDEAERLSEASGSWISGCY